MRSHEPDPSLGTMGGCRDRCAVAVLGRGHRWRLVARPSPTDDQRARTAGRRLPGGEYAGPGPALAGYHAGRIRRPDQSAASVNIAPGWPEPEWIWSLAHPHRFGNPAPDPVAANPIAADGDANPADGNTNAADGDTNAADGVAKPTNPTPSALTTQWLARAFLTRRRW